MFWLAKGEKEKRLWEQHSGGFGASGNSRKSAVFTTNLYGDEQYRVARPDLPDGMKPDPLPHWALESARIKEVV